jgi:hypothetical protein
MATSRVRDLVSRFSAPPAASRAVRFEGAQASNDVGGGGAVAITTAAAPAEAPSVLERRMSAATSMNQRRTSVLAVSLQESRVQDERPEVCCLCFAAARAPWLTRGEGGRRGGRTSASPRIWT